MPPQLGPLFPTTWSGTPPHMAPGDLALWARAKYQLDPLVTGWYYDAAVGEGAGPPEDPNDKYAEAFFRLTRKRIDAVGPGKNLWHLIEVRPNAGLGALGAIQTYRSLWERDPPDTKPVLAYIISDRADSDVARTATNAGIRLLVV